MGDDVYSTKKTDALGNEWIEHTNSSGEKVGETHTKTNPLGITTHYHYDADGNKVGESYDDSVFEDIQHHFDKDGNPAGETIKRHCPLGEDLDSWDNYNENGDLVSETYKNGDFIDPGRRRTTGNSWSSAAEESEESDGTESTRERDFTDTGSGSNFLAKLAIFFSIICALAIGFDKGFRPPAPVAPNPAPQAQESRKNQLGHAGNSQTQKGTSAHNNLTTQSPAQKSDQKSNIKQQELARAQENAALQARERAEREKKEHEAKQAKIRTEALAQIRSFSMPRDYLNCQKTLEKFRDGSTFGWDNTYKGLQYSIEVTPKRTYEIRDRFTGRSIYGREYMASISIGGQRIESFIRNALRGPDGKWTDKSPQ